MGNDDLLIALMSGGYAIANSVETDAGYLQQTPSGAGDRKKWTFSTWVKMSTFSGNSSICTAGYLETDRASFAFEDGTHKIRPAIRVGGSWVYLSYSTNTFTKKRRYKMLA